MAEKSGIQWTDHTFNPWSGCTKVSAGCANCYAEVNYSVKMRGVKWGPNGNRIVAAESMWSRPVAWQKYAVKNIEDWRLHAYAGSPPPARPRVFCASLADVFEDWRGPMLNAGKQVLFRDTLKPAPWTTGYTMLGTPDRSPGAFAGVTMADVRTRLFRLIDDTPNLDWLVLTKRPENIERMLPIYFPGGYIAEAGAMNQEGPRPNLWLGTSVEDRKATSRIDVLRKIPAAIRFLSIEPLIEDLGKIDLTGIHWVIIGGESGAKSRACYIAWIRSVLEQCKAQGVSVFVKQLGSEPAGDVLTLKMADKKGGDMAEWPEDLRVREFPKAVPA